MSSEGRIRFVALVPDDDEEMRFLAERALGSLSEFRKLDAMEPCRNCTHPQESHDDDDHCTVCDCKNFEYEVSE